MHAVHFVKSYSQVTVIVNDPVTGLVHYVKFVFDERAAGEKFEVALNLSIALIVVTLDRQTIGARQFLRIGEKAKGDWSANEAGEYAKNCVFRSED